VLFRLFARLWNESIREQGLALARLPEPAAAPRGKGSARLSVADQSPGSESNVFLGYLKAIHGATRRIRIENAYVITFPALREALLDALARGVEVEVLTNSGESVDEPIISAPILNSLPELIAAGAKVYLKRGDTLHSKFMTVDGVFSTIGSFNLHPRSIRYELEMSVQSVSPALAARLDRAFEADIAAARRVTSADELKIPDSPLHFLVMRYMFNQL
jgi:cardiolipin synthase